MVNGKRNYTSLYSDLVLYFIYPLCRNLGFSKKKLDDSALLSSKDYYSVCVDTFIDEFTSSRNAIIPEKELLEAMEKRQQKALSVSGESVRVDDEKKADPGPESSARITVLIEEKQVSDVMTLCDEVESEIRDFIDREEKFGKKSDVYKMLDRLPVEEGERFKALSEVRNIIKFEMLKNFNELSEYLASYTGNNSDIVSAINKIHENLDVVVNSPMKSIGNLVSRLATLNEFVDDLLYAAEQAGMPSRSVRTPRFLSGLVQPDILNKYIFKPAAGHNTVDEKEIANKIKSLRNATGGFKSAHLPKKN